MSRGNLLHKLHFLAAAAAAMVVVAACGSTVDRAARTAADRGETSLEGDRSDEASVDEATGEEIGEGLAAAGDTGGRVESQAGTSEQGGRGAETTRAGAQPQQIAPGLIPAGAGARGVTDTAIRVGIWYFDPGSAGVVLNALTGTSGASGLFPERKDIQKIVDYLNKNGGFAGRKLEPVWHEADAAQAAQRSSRDQEAQRICSKFTEDNKVLAFMMYYGGPLRDCALRTNTIAINDGLAGAQMSESMLSKGYRDIWYSASYAMLGQRRGRSLVEGLWSQGFFGRDAKVAILVHDEEAAKDGIDNGAIPALARHGINPVAKIIYPDGIESPWHNYILQLQSAGVTHVLFSGDEMTFYAPFFAMRAAEDQQYRPRWGVASDQQPGVLTNLGAPRQQLANLQGIGWNRPSDGAESAEDPAFWHASPTAAACRDVTGDSPVIVRNYCEMLFFLQFGLNQASEISTSGFSAAMDRVGTGYRSAFTIDGLTSFSRENHHGPTVYRDFTYDAARCTDDSTICFKYTSPPKPLTR